MINLICLAFPALFSAYILERLVAKNIGLHNFIFVFVANSIAVNFLSFLLIFWLTDYRMLVFCENGNVRISHCFAFLLVSVFVSLVVAFIEAYYYKNFRFNMKDDENKNKTENSIKEDK